MKKRVGWSGQTKRHSNAKKYGVAGGKYATPKKRFKTQIFNDFLKDVDYKTAKKETEYAKLNEDIRKQIGKSSVVSAYDIFDVLNSDKGIKTIHNHPFESPPSREDIYSFLVHKNMKKIAVVLPSGKTYLLTRNDKTTNLFGSFITPKEKRANLTGWNTLENERVRDDEGYINAMNLRNKLEKRGFNRIYKLYEDIEIDNQRIKYNFDYVKMKENRAKVSFEIQENVLKNLSRVNNFDLKIEEGNN